MAGTPSSDALAAEGCVYKDNCCVPSYEYTLTITPIFFKEYAAYML